jgi:hypothetical protein
MKEKHAKGQLQSLLITLVFVGDIFFCFCGLTLG